MGLRFEVQGIHRQTDVNRGDDAVDAKALPRIDRHFGDFRGVRSKRVVHGDAAGVARRQWCPPSGLLRRERQHVLQPFGLVGGRVVAFVREICSLAQIGQSQLDRIDAAGVGQLVEDALDDECVEVVGRRTQRAGGH